MKNIPYNEILVVCQFVTKGENHEETAYWIGVQKRTVYESFAKFAAWVMSHGRLTVLDYYWWVIDDTWIFHSGDSLWPKKPLTDEQVRIVYKFWDVIYPHG